MLRSYKYKLGNSDFNYDLAKLKKKTLKKFFSRYAAVFWGTNKSLSFLFLFQMLLNAAQNVLAINGFQVRIFLVSFFISQILVKVYKFGCQFTFIINYRRSKERRINSKKF